MQGYWVASRTIAVMLVIASVMDLKERAECNVFLSRMRQVDGFMRTN